MVVATVYVKLVNAPELAALIKAFGEEGLHSNVTEDGANWKVEVTKP